MFPIVTHENLVDLFQSIVFWNWKYKLANKTQGANCYCCATFTLAFALLIRCKILPECRVKRLQASREFARKVLRKTLVLQQQNALSLADFSGDTFGKDTKQIFCAKISSDECIRGNTIPHRTLLSSKSVFLTRRGIVLAPLAAQRISHLLTREGFEEVAREFHEMPGFIKGIAQRRRMAKLEASKETGLAERIKVDEEVKRMVERASHK